MTTRVVVGIGLTGSATGDDVEQAVTTALSACGRAWTDVAALATSEARRSHPAVVAVAGRRGLRLAAHRPEALAQVAVPHPSASVDERAGSPSVAEAAALLTANALATGRPIVTSGIADLLDPKRCTDRVCTAVAAVSPPVT